MPRWGSRVRSPSRASFFAFFYMTGMEPARGFGLRSAPVGAKRVPLARGGLRSAPVGAKRVPLARSTVSRFFLRRRQAKVPDSCLHEMKALWRPPDIEHEMRDGGGDAGWVVLRLAAYYPLFLGTGIGVFTPLRSALSACHRHAAPLAGWRYTGATGAQRPALFFFSCSIFPNR